MSVQLPSIKLSENALSHSPKFERPWKKSLLKTSWEKEKMQVTSIFSFSNNVFFFPQNKFQFFSHFFLCRLQMISISTKA